MEKREDWPRLQHLTEEIEMRVMLVAFDMDGVLTLERSSWEFVHRYLGVDNSDNLELYRKSEISYREFLARDVRRWLEVRPDMTTKDLDKILSGITAVKNLKSSVRALKDAGITCAIISGGLKPLARRIGTESGIGIVMANDIVPSEDGRLTENGIIMVDPKSKDVVLRDIQKNTGIKPDSTVSVGDSPEDARMFSLSASSIFIAEGRKSTGIVATSVLPPGDLKPVADTILEWNSQ